MIPIVIVCLECGLAIRVIGNQEEAALLIGDHSDMWPDKYSCPRCEKQADGMLETEIEAEVMDRLDIRDLNPQEAYAAFNGLGLPDEQKCGLEAATELFKKFPVRSIVGKNVPGTTRCVVYELQLTDGTRICFTSSPSGACIYRIVRPTSYTEKASG
jgi:hypothetical protein